MAKSIPSKIAKALIAIQKSIDMFFKDSRNNHQSFNYVSIDAYYEQIRPLLNEHDLIFLINEVDAKATADTQVVKIQYQLSILHVDGDIWETGLNRHIYARYRNETSCGSALSYAEKNFFRTLFKIPTGEKMEKEETMIPDSDPDGHKQPKPKNTPVAEPTSVEEHSKYDLIREGKVRQSCTEVKSYMSALLSLDKAHLHENVKGLENAFAHMNKVIQKAKSDKKNVSARVKNVHGYYTQILDREPSLNTGKIKNLFESFKTSNSI